MNKADIINHLAGVHRYRDYLELCSLTTGGKYAEIDRSKLSCRRLMYRCPENFDDGLTVDYRSHDDDISSCLQAIRDDKPFDIALIDSFHEYDISWRDLAQGFDLMRDGGSLVVHDCLPPSREVAHPTFIPGAWCGISYEAFIDFVTTRDDLAYYTVDTDYGCGVIRKSTRGDLVGGLLPQTDDEEEYILQTWRGLKADHAARFEMFERHQQCLLKLISVDEFLARERLPHRR